MSKILANFHTHSIICDGKDSPEEMVLEAIAKGFHTLGFSGHGYTDFDLRYCVRDIPAYLAEIRRLKEKYRDKITVLVGLEEDAFELVDRTQVDYIIGSMHYFYKDGKYFSIDGSREYFAECLEVFNHDVIQMAETYYSAFCEYILRRKPDIIGHFDLITKFEDVDGPFFLDNPKYHEIAEKYLLQAIKSECIFEVNTGAIARGYRTSPYPHERLLYLLKKEGAKIILTSDCHKKEMLDCAFEETKNYLQEIGFHKVCLLTEDGVKEQDL